MGLLKVAVAGVLFAPALAAPRSILPRAGEVYNDFASIPVTKDIKWVPCFGDLLCTNLEVPLDYKDASAGTTTIAFIKQVGGDGTGPDILFNPGESICSYLIMSNLDKGGPGGSGVEPVIAGNGKQFLGLLGGNFNFVGFDPRGVKNSGPALTCFPDAPTSRAQAKAVKKIRTLPLRTRYFQYKAENERCSKIHANTKAKYASTSAVAQDLKYFIEKQAVANGKSAAQAKLWYFGGSYGTVIGTTFASLFPDRVERMILEANQASDDYYRVDVRNDSATTDAAVGSFFKFCAQAGPGKCPFAGSSGATAEQIEARYNNLLQKLEKDPVVASSLAQPYGFTISDRDVRLFMFSKAYTPLGGFDIAAVVLTELDAGKDTTYIADRYPEFNGTGVYPDVISPSDDSDDDLQMIRCLDANTRYFISSADQYVQLYEQITKASKYGGQVLALSNAPLCVGFSIVPPQSQIFAGLKITKTAKPIFFINGIRDPITPPTHAYKNSKYFTGSAVLEIDGSGHGLANIPSLCAYGYVQQYMVNGTLPRSGTRCKADLTPIVDAPYVPSYS
ncbi:hypothetical protein M011DRAFT_455438 [Sporormia fimetaria CBS 119925]|uniref:Alpha/beta-hydrolase n=1 Tax=Sporormia fimetaria CBS 119925 TaxID=1340428 RepID=A0A6A6VLI6_9PLEO|nr:hypothetical protein M011DRAFT_455438 [Sporormia fimetaria CBS 119925]